MFLPLSLFCNPLATDHIETSWPKQSKGSTHLREGKHLNEIKRTIRMQFPVGALSD